MQKCMLELYARVLVSRSVGYKLKGPNDWNHLEVSRSREYHRHARFPQVLSAYVRGL